MPQKGGWGGGGASEPIASWVAEFGPSDEWIRLLSGGPLVVGALTTLTGLAIASVFFFFFQIPVASQRLVVVGHFDCGA